MRILFTFLVLAVSLLSLGNSGGRAFVARMGNTGAPGDNRETCQSCHNSAAIQVSMAIEVRDENEEVVTSYIPGKTYDVTVRINAERGTPVGYGFQMVALNAPLDENGEPINNWMDNETNLKLVTLNSGRMYAEHDGVSREPEFTVQWEAPESGSGDVSFYAAGNGVNFNGGSSGDGASTQKISLTEAPPVSVNRLLANAEAVVGPNPAQERITLTRGDRLEERWTVTVFSMGGQALQTRWMDAGTDVLDLELTGMNPGVYLMQVSNGFEFQAIRFVKN